MALEDIAQLTDALAKTHVGDEELSYKGKGLKLDNAESAAEIVKAIQEFNGLGALRLEGNTIGVGAAQAIAKALESKSELQRCYWSDMFTGRLRSEIPCALRCLGNAVVTSGARLIELDLSDNAFGPDGVKGIETLLKTPSCHTLRQLKLNNCGMGIEGGKILAEALIECHKQSSAAGAPLSLKVFIAGRNRLENDGAIALSKALKLMGSLEEVHMPQNGINHAGITALAGAMQKNPELRVLNLNDNTFTKRGSLAMAQALTHLQNIQAINFGDCLVRSEGALAIAAALRDGLPILKELNLSFGELSEATALVLVRCAKDKPQLESLDFNGNCFGEEGCETLRETAGSLDMADILGSLSDDEGEPDEEEDEEEDEENEDEEEGTEEEDMNENGLQKSRVSNGSPVNPDQMPPSCSPDLETFLSSPTAERLLDLGAKRTLLIEQLVDYSDPIKMADLFFTISSVYKDDASVKKAVLDSTDALLKKALSGPYLQTYGFLSSLLLRLGLLKGEGKSVRMEVLPGHLLALGHAVEQEYFPADHADILQAFLSKGALKALIGCSNAKEVLQSALDRKATV